jgi:hypothetical protein
MKIAHPDPGKAHAERRALDEMAVLHKLAEQSGDGMVTELYLMAMDRAQDPAFPQQLPASRTRSF